MNWIWLMIRDFFFALGVIAFLGPLIVLEFMDGEVSNVPLVYFPVAACFYSLVMGNLYHWPKEMEDKE